jgi:hypothetical protein
VAHLNPYGKNKAVAIGPIKDPRGAAESVAGSARGTVLLGRVVAGQVGSRFLRKPLPAETRTRRPAAPTSPPPAPSAPAANAATAKAPTTKAPTARAPKAPKPPQAKPEVTPADIAANIAPKAPTRTAPPKPRKAPAKKSAPGAKLPPRKVTPAE